MIKMVNIILKIFIALISITFIYEMIILVNNICKNLKIKYNIMLYLNVQKINKLKYISKLQLYIYELKKIDKKRYNFLSVFFVLIISIVFSISIFLISKNIFSINSTSIILSIFSFFIPYFIIEKIFENRKRKILYKFPMYILSLKNYIYSTNDILLAFKKANVPSCFELYVNKFNISIEKGMGIVQAVENLKKDINIDIISNFLDSVIICHFNGGNVCKLLNKYIEILTKINFKKSKQVQENLSNLIIFMILVIINIFLIFTFIYSNEEYKKIIITTFIGKTIININILSYVLIFFLYKKINNQY